VQFPRSLCSGENDLSIVHSRTTRGRTGGVVPEAQRVDRRRNFHPRERNHDRQILK